METADDPRSHAAGADARKEAAGETGLLLDTIPGAAPFLLAQVMDEGFWAEPARS